MRGSGEDDSAAAVDRVGLLARPSIMVCFRKLLLHATRRFVLAGPQIACMVFGIVAVSLSAQTGPADAAALQRYQHDVVPVLQSNCLRCHGGMNRRSGYSMSTRAAAIAGGRHGTAIVPGQPDNSLLVRLIGPGPYPDDIKAMPLKGKLTDAEVATLRRWVADGAVMDR